MLGQNKTTKCKPSALGVSSIKVVVSVSRAQGVSSVKVVVSVSPALGVSSIKVLVSVSVAFGNCWNKLVTRS